MSRHSASVATEAGRRRALRRDGDWTESGQKGRNGDWREVEASLSAATEGGRPSFRAAHPAAVRPSLRPAQLPCSPASVWPSLRPAQLPCSPASGRPSLRPAQLPCSPASDQPGLRGSAQPPCSPAYVGRQSLTQGQTEASFSLFFFCAADFSAAVSLPRASLSLSPVKGREAFSTTAARTRRPAAVASPRPLCDLDLRRPRSRHP